MFEEEIFFAQNSTWLEIEKVVKVCEPPATVSETIKTRFNGWKIMEADKIAIVNLCHYLKRNRRRLVCSNFKSWLRIKFSNPY